MTNLRQDVNTCLNTGYFGLSMLEEMRCAAFGGKLDSNASQFQASDAFYAATIAGAQGLGAPLGRIEPGFAADLLLVDPTRLGPHNYPLIELVYRAESADIVGRMVGGRMLSRSAQDLRKSAQAAQAAAQKGMVPCAAPHSVTPSLLLCSLAAYIHQMRKRSVKLCVSACRT